MEIKPNNIYHGDCVELLPFVASKSIDVILCDLPYGTTKNKWDIIIPFESLWPHYERIIKDNGIIILFGQGLFTAKLMLSNEKLWKYNLIWEKDRPSGFLNAKKMPLRSHEDICVFYKNPPTYKPIMVEGKENHRIGKVKGEKNCKNNNNYGEFGRIETEGTLKYPRSVHKFAKHHPPIHPTQKPVELCEYLLKTYSNENDLVLDNCFGSGSTLIAAQNTNRQFVGIEQENVYFQLTKARIEKNFKKEHILVA